MIIRDAEHRDLDIIQEIMNDAILNTTAIYDYGIRTKEFVEDWFNKKHNDNMPVLVSEVDGKAVAFGSYGIFRPRDAYRFSVEHSIYVKNDFQRQGIGKQLLNALIDKSKKDGYHTMIAGIDAANQSSYQFHKNLGFVEAGRIREVGYKFDRWLDLIFMQLML